MEDFKEEPEREGLRFEIGEDNNGELFQVQKTIQQAAETLLYHWKNFPIVLPPSITDKVVIDENEREKPLISFKDLFISPTFDELEAVSLDDEGNAKSLNSVQLQTVRTNGEFDVSSKNFPGQNHRWRLTQLLQKGTAKSKETHLNDIAVSLKLLIVTAKNRIVSPFFSLSNSLTSLTKAGCQLLDILIGLPGIGPGDLDASLHQEHMKYLVAELDIKQNQRAQFNIFCEYVTDKNRELESLRHQTVEFKTPLPCYTLQTPNGQDIDLRLFNRDLLNRCKPILKRILTKQSKGWYIKYKDKLIAEMKEDDPDDQLTAKTISEHVNRCIKEEYLRRVFEALEQSQDLEAISPGLGVLLAEQGKASVVMNRAVNETLEKLESHAKELTTHLIKTYPVRSRIHTWMEEKLKGFRADFVQLNQWVPHEEAIEQCRLQTLQQAVYFLQRDLTYFRDREPVLTKELGKVRRGTRTFVFAQRIWLPGNWIVKRTLYGETEVIPTVIVEGVRDFPRITNKKFDEPSFAVEKCIYRKTSTKFPFWRWINYFMRTWTWTWNAMFWLGVAVPWCSPVSFRALFYSSPFIPALQLNPNNGTLSQKLSSKTHTLRSRLAALWRNVQHSRTQFEAEPNTGFLDKSFTRMVNRFWNYVIKGCLGSAGIVLGFAPLCVVASSLSVLAGFLAPLWMPFVTLVVHLFFVTIYDFDSPGEGRFAYLYLFEAIIYRFLILGILQPICAFLSASIFLPIASASMFVFGLLRRGCRELWDLTMFHAVIQKRARVPASNGFVAKRISGPGLAANYFYQVKPEQVLAAAESHMEEDELTIWENNLKDLAYKPMAEYKSFAHQLFSPYSAFIKHPGMTEETIPYVNLADEISENTKDIEELVALRRQKLYTGLTPHLRSHIKLQAEDLQTALTETTKLVEEFYPNRVFSRQQPEKVDDYWDKRQLEDNDWGGLAKQILAEVFAASFLTPLEETDTVFRLEIQHLNLGRYVDMLKSGDVHDDLDETEAIHTPKGDIDVDAPYFEESNFSPVKQDVDYAEFYNMSSRKRNWPWKRRQTLNEMDLQKLQIPLPILHPAVIAAHVYNRDNDQDPIDVDDPLCQRILRAAEHTAYTDNPQTRVEFNEDISTPDHTTNSGDSEIQKQNITDQ